MARDTCNIIRIRNTIWSVIIMGDGSFPDVDWKANWYGPVTPDWYSQNISSPRKH